MDEKAHAYQVITKTSAGWRLLDLGLQEITSILEFLSFPFPPLDGPSPRKRLRLETHWSPELKNVVTRRVMGRFRDSTTTQALSCTSCGSEWGHPKTHHTKPVVLMWGCQAKDSV